MNKQKIAKFKIGDSVEYYRRGICYPGIIREDKGIRKGAGRIYRITPPEDGQHDLEWFVFDVAERHLSEPLSLYQPKYNPFDIIAH